MIAPLLLLLELGQPGAAQPTPTPTPAQGAASGTANDITSQATIIYELGEHQLNAQESWFLKSPSGKTIPAAEVRIPMPKGAKFLRLDDKRPGFRGKEDSSAIEATSALGAEGKELTAGYLLDFSGSTADIERTIPFALSQSRIVVQEVPGLSITTNVESQRRTHDLGGNSFIIYDLAPMPKGAKLQLTLNGLPARTLWPRRAALFLIVVIVGWMVYALATRSVPRGDPEARSHNPLSARARRDQLVKAIEVLERDFQAEQVKEKRYQRRREDLMKELALVLRELELEDAEVEADLRGGQAPGASSGA